MLTQPSPRAKVPSTEALTDELIVDRVLAGQLDLFEILMRRNNTRVYRAIRSLLRDEAEVEDAMQATYVLAFSKLRSFRGGARFSTWLTRIALNEALGRLRRDQRHPSVPLTPLEESAMSSVASPPPTPENQASRRELAGLLESAVDSLPELYRVVFVLREIEGMDTAEAAAALEITEDGVKTRMTRARSMLRDSLARLAGMGASEAFGFHASRCDRVVGGVMEKLRAFSGAER